MINPTFINEIKELENKKTPALIKEMYLQAKVRLKIKEYCNFLVLVFAFEESVLRYLMIEVFLGHSCDEPWKKAKGKVHDALKAYKGGKLYHQFKVTKPDLDCPTMLKILKTFPKYNNLVQPLVKLESYRRQRNDYIHQFEGVSQIENEQEVKNSMETILQELNILSQENTFSLLNQEINARLTI